MLAILLIDFLASWDENVWINNSRSFPTFKLVLDKIYLLENVFVLFALVI